MFSIVHISSKESWAHTNKINWCGKSHTLPCPGYTTDQATYPWHPMANKFCSYSDDKQTKAHTLTHKKRIPCDVIIVYAGTLNLISNACKCVGDMDSRKWYIQWLQLVHNPYYHIIWQYSDFVEIRYSSHIHMCGCHGITIACTVVLYTAFRAKTSKLDYSVFVWAKLHVCTIHC